MTQGNEFHDRDAASAELRAEIEQTRTRVAADVEAIGEKLSPQNLKHEAKHAISRRVNERTAGFRHRVQRGGAAVRSNPLPFALIGAGVGLLLLDARRRRREAFEPSGEAYDAYGYEEELEPSTEPQTSVRERAGQLESRVAHRAEELGRGASELRRKAGDRASELRQRAGEGLGRASHRAEHMLHENPLAVGAVAVAAGLGVGLLLPSSRREDRWLGERRDQLMGKAREKVHDLGEVAAETARRAADSAKETARQTARGEAERLGLYHSSSQPNQPQAEGQQATNAGDLVVEETEVVSEAWPPRPGGDDGRER